MPVADALDAGERIIERTGATSYRPLVVVERAALARLVGDAAGRRHALAEAQRLFTAIGAIGYAERLAPELRA